MKFVSEHGIWLCEMKINSNFEVEKSSSESSTVRAYSGDSNLDDLELHKRCWWEFLVVVFKGNNIHSLQRIDTSDRGS